MLTEKEPSFLRGSGQTQRLQNGAGPEFGNGRLDVIRVSAAAALQKSVVVQRLVDLEESISEDDLIGELTPHGEDIYSQTSFDGALCICREI